MNTDFIKGKWQQIKGDLQKTWGKITNDEWEATKGETNSVSGLVQNKYGHTKEEIGRKLSEVYDKHTSSDSNFVNQRRPNVDTTGKQTTEF